MTKYIVQGGHPLFGEVRISGAKNAAVAIRHMREKDSAPPLFWSTASAALKIFPRFPT